MTINATIWVSLADQDPIAIVRGTMANQATANMEVVALLRAAADVWEQQAPTGEMTAADVVT